MHVRQSFRAGTAALAAGVPAILLLLPASAPAQASERAQSGAPSAATLDSLVTLARSANPELRAVRARVRAAEARVSPAGARPDPMLMAGIQNFPLAEPGFNDFMTMKMIGVSQSIPRPGKLASRTRAAEHAAQVARLEADAVELDVIRDVRSAYYQIAYVDQALVIIDRTRDVLASLVGATQARYEAAAGGQQDVIRARFEASRLGEDASALREQRRALVAQLNALLHQPSDVALDRAEIPASVIRAAVADAPPPGRVAFVSPLLGSRAAGSPLPPLDAVEGMAVTRNPRIRAQQATIAMQGARVELARRERQPDFDVSLQYGQRDGFSDMLTAAVSVPLPLQRGRKQDALLAAERAELEALEAGLLQERAQLRADVARLYAEVERARTHLALAVRALLPQSRAALESAVASYQAGRSEFVAVLDAHAALFNAETSYFRAQSDFASALADMERLVGGGGEVLP